MLNLKVRFKNPVFVIQLLGTALFTALSYNYMNPQDLTTWSGLFALIQGIFMNPYLLGLCAWNVWSAINDPTTKGLSDSKQAMTYEEPRGDE